MSIEISPKSFFEQPSVADMRLIACPGAEELTGLIDKHLVRWLSASTSACAARPRLWKSFLLTPMP